MVILDTVEKFQHALDMAYESDDFTKMKNISRFGLNPIEILVAVYLAQVINYKDEVATTQIVLAEITGYCVNTICAVIARLVEVGLISKTVKKGYTIFKFLKGFTKKSEKSKQIEIKSEEIKENESKVKAIAIEYTEVMSKQKPIDKKEGYSYSMFIKGIRDTKIVDSMLKKISEFKEKLEKFEKRKEIKRSIEVHEIQEQSEKEIRNNKIDEFFRVTLPDAINELKQKVLSEFKFAPPPEKILRGLIYNEAMLLNPV